MTELLAILGLILSALILWVQYKNQVERRHGEIVQLKGQILGRLAGLRQRIAALLIQAQTIRIEMRLLPDNEDKYRSIERFPKSIEGLEAIKGLVDEQVSILEKIDTAKHNRTDILMRLQNVASNFETIEPQARKVEDDMIALLGTIRTRSAE